MAQATFWHEKRAIRGGSSALDAVIARRQLRDVERGIKTGPHTEMALDSSGYANGISDAGWRVRCIVPSPTWGEPPRAVEGFLRKAKAT